MVCPYPILGSLENILYTHPKITLVGVEDMIYFVGLNSPQQTIWTITAQSELRFYKSY